MATTRWNIAVSSEMDQSVRMFLAAQGGGRKGDLSRFIAQAKNAASTLKEEDLTNLIDEAVEWARVR
jgi:hypothetical protein